MEVERKKGDRQICGKAMGVTFAPDYEASTRLVRKHLWIQVNNVRGTTFANNAAIPSELAQKPRQKRSGFFDTWVPNEGA